MHADSIPAPFTDFSLKTDDDVIFFNFHARAHYVERNGVHVEDKGKSNAVKFLYQNDN
jgi:hypothetical protein